MAESVANASLGGSAAEKPKPAANSYEESLKSSAVIGGAAVFTNLANMVRTKVLALFLDPAGIGILGIYTSILDLSRNVAVMGLNNSGVRQIAEAVASGETVRVDRTIATVRWAVRIFAVLGALALVALCVPVAGFSFTSNAGNAWGVALLAIAVFFAAISAGQIGLLQGLRRIGDLARANVFGAILGCVGSVAAVFILHERGIVPSLIFMALGTLGASWWLSRKIKTAPVTMSSGEFVSEASGLLKLGFAFMATGLMSFGVIYLTRIMVAKTLGDAEAGYYNAAAQLGGLYVNYILSAMGQDFFPRLTAAAKDNVRCNQLVNEQAETSLLLAGPGILGTLTFTPLVILIFYSAKFGPAVEVLRWFCLGAMLRVASWPMGFILLAKGARNTFFWSELAANVTQVVAVWLCLKYFGLKGSGMAVFFAGVIYWFQIYFIARAVSGFRWSRENKIFGAAFAVLIAVVFLLPYFFNDIMTGIIGTVITLPAGYFSVKKICSLIPFSRFPRPAQRILTLLRLGPVNPPPTGT